MLCHICNLHVPKRLNYYSNIHQLNLFLHGFLYMPYLVSCALVWPQTVRTICALLIFCIISPNQNDFNTSISLHHIDNINMYPFARPMILNNNSNIHQLLYWYFHHLELIVSPSCGKKVLKQLMHYLKYFYLDVKEKSANLFKCHSSFRHYAQTK